MRLRKHEKKAIIDTIAFFDAEADVYLYGSRCDDTKRGGDIDIAIISPKIDSTDRSRIRLKLYDILGEQKIDIISGKTAEGAFLKKAVKTGVLLNGE